MSSIDFNEGGSLKKDEAEQKKRERTGSGKKRS